MTDYPYPPFPEQEQDLPGSFRRMDPVPDHGEDSWKGNGRLTGRVALITGADSGIGRAVATAYAREGADLALVCLDEKGDMEDTAALVRQAGRECLVIMTDLSKAENCRDVIAQTADRFGRIDILVNNAAHQRSFAKIEDISDEEWRYTFATNIDAMFHLTKAAVAHMGRGAAIINTASVNADKPSPDLLVYATTKGAIQNFTAGLAQMLADRGIRANVVAPGPVWTPLIPASFPGDKVATFGQNYPIGRPAQPAELASAYVMLAEAASSYISGATIAVTGGQPII